MTFKEYTQQSLSPEEFLIEPSVDFDENIENLPEDRLLLWLINSCDLSEHDLEDCYAEGMSVREIAQEMLNNGYVIELL